MKKKSFVLAILTGVFCALTVSIAKEDEYAATTPNHQIKSLAQAVLGIIIALI